MPVPTDITAGTLTITNGSTAVTGVGTSWLASDLRQGDVILWIEGGDGFQTPILADVPASNTALTLVEPWEGPTLTGVRYRIRYQWDSSRVSAQSRQLIELLDNGNILALSGLTGPGVPVFDGPHSMVIKPESDFVNGVAYDVQVDTLADRDTYDGQAAGYSVLVSDIGDGRSAVYSKASNASGDWTDPAYVTGATGATGPFTDLTFGPVTTTPYGTPASVNVVPVDPDTVRLDFSIPAGQNGTGTGDVVGPSSAIANRIAVFSGTTGKLIADGGKTLAEMVQVIPHFYGLITSNTFGQTKGVDVQPGSSSSRAGTATLVLPSTLSKLTSAVWAAGNLVGGVDVAGSLNLADATYHVFIIGKAGGADPDILLSASPLAPTLPSGYSEFRRVSAFTTTSTGGVIRPFRQVGGWFHYLTPVLDAVTVAIGAATVMNVTVPAGIKVQAELFVSGAASTGGTVAYLGVCDPDLGNANNQHAVLSFYSQRSSAIIPVWTDTVRRIGVFSDNGGNLIMYTRGWYDDRDRNI